MRIWRGTASEFTNDKRNIPEFYDIVVFEHAPSHAVSTLAVWADRPSVLLNGILLVDQEEEL